MVMRDWPAMFYWASAGACVGLGGLLIFSIGLPLLLLGLGLLAYGVRRKVGLTYLWAALVTLGWLSAGAMLLNYLTLSAQPGVLFAPGFLLVVAFFAAIGLAGLGLGVLTGRRQRSMPRAQR